MGSAMRTATRALAIVVIEGATAAALAYFAFRRLWQLSALLPAFAFFDFAVAWGLHLRKDGFAGRKGAVPRRRSGSALALIVAGLGLLICASILYFVFGVGAAYFPSSVY